MSAFGLYQASRETFISMDVYRYGVRGQSNVGPANQLVLKPELIEQPEPVVLAFDIECTKMPLKFPTAVSDQVSIPF